ncbi:DNA polymerase alpha/epsilon subunit B-domain-containing protein [Lipomyces oligophaga]|uniref:DNA polymerase alpha/epsilon subunit B-domain-containing protein n=1 Tax=Lipomyces oligophaga TaxID=45792 RepID=UPI0034CEAAB3
MPGQNLSSFTFNSLNAQDPIRSKQYEIITDAQIKGVTEDFSVTQAPINAIPPLPIELSPGHMRPIAYRILSKKHGLNLKSSGLEYLAMYIGRKFGKDWRTSCEPFLNEIAKRWKEQDKGLFIDAVLLPKVIQDVELRATSLLSMSTADSPMASANVLNMPTPVDILETFLAQEFCHIWDAFEQPRWVYNKNRKTFDKGSPPNMFPSAQDRSRVLHNRYYQILHRIQRNEDYQRPSFHSSRVASWKAITPIKNLLGRTGQQFLLLGFLVRGYNGNLYAEDPSGRIELELESPTYGEGYFTPGEILLFEGIYTRAEKLRIASMHHPPIETRKETRDVYGYLDFMGIAGIGSVPDGRYDKVIEQKMASEERHRGDRLVIVLGSDIFLDDLRTFDALEKVFSTFEETHAPTAIILSGSFVSKPFFRNGSSSHYKENFNQLAQLLSKFPRLCSKSTFVFIPGPNDPWSSTASAGGPTLWPQRAIPDIFTSKVRRVLSKSVWASNPCRICYFSQEIVVCRDDFTSRFIRNDISNRGPQFSREHAEQMMDIDIEFNIEEDTLRDDVLSQTTEIGNDLHLKSPDSSDNLATKAVVTSIIKQGHLSPWPSDLRPTISDYEHALSLSTLPHAMFLLDPSSSPYTHVEAECTALNPAKFLVKNHDIAWFEYNLTKRTSKLNSINF